MKAMSKRLRSYLDAQSIEYERIHHRRDYTAQQTAQSTHTRGSDFAKTVLIWLDGLPAMVVMPAPAHVDLRKLRELTGARDVDLATEDEIGGICHDCEIGAEPPFGNLYDLPVYISQELAKDHDITFNAGTHEEAIRMSYTDYERLVQPLMLDLATDH